MPKCVVIYKNVGETPLQCMEAWRRRVGLAADIPLTYAGRLDPLASGKLLVLVGEECKQKDYYLGFDKQYEIEIVCGLSSDSGDVLGLITPQSIPQPNHEQFLHTVKKTYGSITLPYPAFSSKPVRGQPLHTWAAAGRLHEITIPTKTSTIYNLRLKATTTYTKHELYQKATANIARIPPVTDHKKKLGNDFRRVSILERWHSWYTQQPDTATFFVARLLCNCSSGTYMRSLAEYLGAQAGSGALATEITRTKIGRYHPLTRYAGFWWPSY